jgi:hypothetical protein
MSRVLKVIATVAAIYFTAGAAALVSATAFAGAGIATIASVANYLAVGAVLSGIARALQPKPRIAGNPGVLTEYAGTTEPARIVYGRMRVSGLNVIPPLTTGTDNQDLHQVLALAGHEIDGFDEYWANQEQITPAAVTGSSGDGLVSVGTYADRMWVRGYRGTSTQTADFILDQASGSWTSDHRGRGIAYVAITYRYNEAAYRSGKPDISCVVRGKRCYDPRLDTSPGANPTNAAYSAYTNNPALISADYLIDQEIGRRVQASRVNWADVVAAANICDENITGSNSTPLGDQKRYTCNVVLNVAQTIEEHEENQSILAAAMLGVVYRTGGQWRMYAGAWSTPSFTLTPDDVIGTVQVATAIRRRDTWNTINGTFLDATRNYVQQEFPEVTSAAFVSADGRKLPKPISLPACTNVYEAQRAAFVLLRQSRNRRTVTVECGLTHYRVRIWQTGTVTLPEIGWTNQTVRCTGWRLTAEGRVELTLQEAYAADWANPLTGEYGIPGTTPAPTIGFARPGTPVSFTATSVPGGISFSVGRSDPYIAGQVYRIYEAATGGAFGSATRVAESDSETIVVPKSDTTSRDYWVTAQWNGGESAQRPAAAGLAAAARRTDTADLQANAVTDLIAVDTYDGAGASVGASGLGQTLRTVSFTPSTTGRIELSGVLDCEGVDGDQGQTLGWLVEVNSVRSAMAGSQGGRLQTRHQQPLAATFLVTQSGVQHNLLLVAVKPSGSPLTMRVYTSSATIRYAKR